MTKQPTVLSWPDVGITFSKNYKNQLNICLGAYSYKTNGYSNYQHIESIHDKDRIKELVMFLTKEFL